MCILAFAQNQVRVEDKIFNFGAKVGLNSSFPNINDITINNLKAENVSVHYKVGVLAAAFCRINMDRFFIQPSLSWRYSTADMNFDLPVEEGSNESHAYTNRLTYRERSLEAPVLIGYKIVNDGAYGLSFMAGPNIKYNYDIHYVSNYAEYLSDNTPWGISIVCGVGVSIWRLFFDVTYEFGLNQTDSDFKNYGSNEPTAVDITIDKRTNMLSFSLGLLF